MLRRSSACPSIGCVVVIADVEIHHLEKFKKLRFENVSIAAEGPLRASLKAIVKYGQSTINVLVCVAYLTARFGADRYLQISLNAIPGS